MSLLDAQTLPFFIRNMHPMQELLKAEQIELDKMIQVIGTHEKELCINSAEKQLNRYEQMFSLNSDGLKIDERRKNIIAKLNARITATKANLIAEIVELTGHPTEIKEYFDQYYFTVGLIQNNLSDAFVIAVKKYLDEIKPAHLGYDLSLIRYDESFVNAGAAMIDSTIIYMEVF